MLVCSHLHTKSFEECTYTPAILSPRNEMRKSSSNNHSINEPNNVKPPYQIWMQLMQRIRDRTLTPSSSSERTISPPTRYSHSVSRNTSPVLGVRRERTWAGRESISPWYNDRLNSNKQVVTLINHYTNLLSAESNESFNQGLNDRPKSILRPIGSPNKFRFTKEVTFATN